ncbi:unnamed protein product [Amoebophrya sp. A120]|nr:unnamed protein product [Amoebophrya sp. A120]|eukprot:GSA120T00016513001.1
MPTHNSSDGTRPSGQKTAIMLKDGPRAICLQHAALFAFERHTHAGRFSELVLPQLSTYLHLLRGIFWELGKLKKIRPSFAAPLYQEAPLTHAAPVGSVRATGRVSGCPSWEGRHPVAVLHQANAIRLKARAPCGGASQI